jgi:hypothetical protein
MWKVWAVCVELSRKLSVSVVPICTRKFKDLRCIINVREDGVFSLSVGYLMMNKFYLTVSWCSKRLQS